MFKISLLISLLILSPHAFPQSNPSDNFEYKVSKPYDVIDASSKDYLSNGKELLIVKSHHTWITFQKFNSETLQMTDFKEFRELPYFSTEAIVKCKDKFLFFYSVWDKPNLTEQLFVKEIDFQNCDFASEGKLLLKVEGHISADPLGYIYDIGIGTGIKFHISLSDDESKLLVQYRIKPEEKDDNLNHDYIGTYVYDHLCNNLWGQEHKMPHTEAKMDNLKYMVTNDGEVFMLVCIYKDVSKKEDITIEHFELYKCNKGTGEIKSTRLDLEKVYYNFYELYEDPLNKIICLGHHSKSNSYNSEGLSLVKTNPNGAIIDSKTFLLPDNVIVPFEKKNKDKGIPFLQVNDVIHCADSGIIVIEEQSNSQVVSTNYQTHSVYFFEDILVTKITSYGKTEWVKRIPKRQYSTQGKGGLSYAHMINCDYQYFIFLDNIKNQGAQPVDYKRVKDGTGYLVACRISNKTGETKTFPLFDIADVDGIELLQFKTERFCQVSDNEVIVEAYQGGKKDVLVKIHFN